MDYKKNTQKLSKEAKRKLYKPKTWALYENGNFVNTYESHNAAKKAKHLCSVEASRDMLDVVYTIKPYKGI